MKWRVIVDERWADIGSKIDSDATVLGRDRGAAADEALTDRPDVLVVVGDDATVTWVATMLYEQQRRDAVVPLLLVVPTGSVTPVADGVGASLAPQKLRLHLDRGKYGIRTRSSLRVVDASEPSARLAFNFGMGLPFEFLQARARAARSGRRGMIESFAKLAREEVSDKELVEADVFADWTSRAEHFRYLLVNAGDEAWFGVPMSAGERPCFRLGRSALELFESRSRVGRIVQRVTGRGVEPFERIHIDTNSGYVLDGELFDPGVARSIAVTAGPSVRFATI